MAIFKNRTAGFWIGFMASILLLAADILFIITDYGDKTFSFVTFVLILVGAAGEALVLLTKLKFAPLLTSVCFGVAFAVHLYVGLPTLSDVVNGVNFVGGNPTAVIQFGAAFLIGTIAAMISCFMEQSRVSK